MRRVFCAGFVVLAFTGIGCPPAPPPLDTPKQEDLPGESPIKPVDSVQQLKPRIEGALETVRDWQLSTTQHGFWTVFHAILGVGPDHAMLIDDKTGKKVNALQYICDGGTLRGLEFIPTRDGLDVRTSLSTPFVTDPLMHLAQGHQDQFIAEMAQWGTSPRREFMVAGKKYTFKDFIDQSTARASVKQKQELSWAIIIIAQYHDDGTKYQWTNNLGEKVTLEEAVQYELDAPINEAACGGTHRLFGLTWVYHVHLKNGGKNVGVWKDVEKKIADYKALALSLQNPDGSFSTEFFKGPGKNPDGNLRISTTGHILEWLALCMTDEELRSPRMLNAVNALSEMILRLRERADGGGLYHAAHGLHIYHERVFGTPAPYLPLLPR